MDQEYFEIIITDLIFEVKFKTSAKDAVINEYNKLDYFNHQLKLLEAKINVADQLAQFAKLNAIREYNIAKLITEIEEVKHEN
jgi:hypothetical protein